MSDVSETAWTRMIRFTQLTGGEVWVNPAQVVSVERAADDVSRIVVVAGRSYMVNETARSTAARLAQGWVYG